MKAEVAQYSLIAGLLLFSLAACQAITGPAPLGTGSGGGAIAGETRLPDAPAEQGVSADAPATLAPVAIATPLPLPTPTPEPPTLTAEPQPAFAVGNELTIDALLQRRIEGSEITIEQQLEDGANYSRYIASYVSEGNRIYGLLTVPFGDPPEGGFKAIIFNHGYIPPDQYRTTERYVAYVDALARSGFVVFKIDLRGFGNSEGEATGTYFSPDYTIDAIAALKSLQTLDYVDPEGIGMWGHSMAGNLVLRAMLIDPDIKAGVIWAGAVYSYDDFSRFSISDPSYSPSASATSASRRVGQLIRETYGPPNTAEPYWKAVSLTEHIGLLQAPLQLHHALDDAVVNVGYSDDLAAVLNVAGKVYEYYQYDGGGHNIASPYFNEAMRRTIEFFQKYL